MRKHPYGVTEVNALDPLPPLEVKAVEVVFALHGHGGNNCNLIESELNPVLREGWEVKTSFVDRSRLNEIVSVTFVLTRPYRLGIIRDSKKHPGRS